MCGIFGILNHEGTSAPSKSILEETARILRHRGPDSYGIYADAGIGLVQTRLSLLDLNPRSNQPFWDKTGRYCLLFNGEIYNFKELKSELERDSIVLRTTSDTEILLESILAYGTDSILPRLEGMFAFAWFDRVTKFLFIARDRFGTKPLFIYDAYPVFMFTSQVKAMRTYVELESDILSVSSFLLGFGGPTKNHTFFKNVHILPPGAYARIRMGETTQYNTFFSIPDFREDILAEDLKILKRKKIVDKVEELLCESVKQQLIADAPVGAFCSGGVDSAIILAMATRSHNNLAIFHANVNGKDSEYQSALFLAKHLKLDLRSVNVHDDDFLQMFPDVMEHYEHPFLYHPNSVPFLMVANLVHQNKVKAILSGEGSDECYLGYPHLVREHPLGFSYRILETVRRLMGSIPKIRAILPPLEDNSREMVINLHNRFETALETKAIQSSCTTQSGSAMHIRELRSLDLLGYHLRTLLHRNDCLGMAASIEARFPFLNHDLVRIAVNVPFNLKIRFSPRTWDKSHYFLRDKWVLRQVASRYLPREVSERSKRGFPAGAFRRMRISSSYFAGSFIADLFALSSPEFQYLIENCDQALMYRLLHLDAWAHICLHNLPKDDVRQKLKNNITISKPA